MKRISTLVICALLLSLSAFAQMTDLEKNQLKGHVKSVQVGSNDHSLTVFNEKGFIIQENRVINGSMKQLTYIRDSKNRIKKIEDEKGKKVSIKYSYDKNNQLIEFDGVQYVYDSEGKMSKESYQDKYNHYQKDFSYFTGKLSKIIVKGSIEENGEYEETYYFDNNLLSKKEAYDTFFYAYDLDSIGNWVNEYQSTSQITERTKKRATLSGFRQIEYYDENIVAVAMGDATTTQSLFNGEDYYDGLKDRLSNFSIIGGPSNTLLIVVILIMGLLIWWGVAANKKRFKNFSGLVQENGMKRLWMYNKEPYAKVALALFIAVCSFLLALAILFLFGGLTWLVFWIIKILMIILVIVAIICAILGGLALWAGSPWGLLLLLLGVPIWIYGDDIKNAGDRLVETGFQFMQNLNLFEWGLNLFTGYWDAMLLVFVLPMLLFSLFAIIIIILNTTLRGAEFIITKAYNVRRPCPVCGCTDGYYYLVEGQKHPVGLHPGVYGVFSQTSPKNGSKLPTMLLNGRWKLDRECVNLNCKSKVTSNMGTAGSVGYGTDIHIGIVGHRSSGKSYLLYSGLSLLQSTYSSRFTQIDADNETRIEAKKKRIDSGDGIQTDDKSQYRAVQLLLTDKIRRIPYHLFFYDVAGEKFNAASTAHKKAMDFYKNVESIIFVIDPLMIDFTGIPANDDLLRWIEAKDYNEEKYNIGNTFSILKEILEKAGRKSKKIDFSFVCVKKDLGYFEAMGNKDGKLSDKDIERFICNDMALNNIVNSAKAEFKDVKFFAVSAISKDTESLKVLFAETLRQRGIKL